MGLDIQKSNPLKLSQPQPAPQTKPVQQTQTAQAPKAQPANAVVDTFETQKKAAPVSLTGEGKQTTALGLPSWASGSAIKELGNKLWGQVTDKLGLESNIQRLGDGDKFAFTLGGDASLGAVVGGTVYGKAKVEIERKDEKGNKKYTVSVEGEAGLGIVGEVGGKTGVFGSASASLQQTYGAASKVEFSFDSPEDAARAAEILAKQNLATAQPSLAPFVKPSAEEYEFLQKNLASIELRGNGAAQLAGDLGIGDEDQALIGAFGEANAKLETGVKIEFQNGSPSAVVIKSGAEFEVKGSAAVGAGAVASGKGTVSQEMKYPLPQGLSWSDFATDPSGAVRKVGASLMATEQKVTVQQEYDGSALGVGRGLRSQVEYSGKPGTIPVDQIAQRMKAGDLGGAVAAAGNHVNVNMYVAPYTSQGFNFSPSVSFFGTGVGVEISAQRQDANPWRYQGTATQGAAALNQQLRQLPGWNQLFP
jgi:hypothetical protein